MKRRVTKHNIHILLYNMLLLFLCNPYYCQVEVLSLTLDMQRCNELYKLVKFSYIRHRNHANNEVFSQFIFLTLLFCSVAT